MVITLNVSPMAAVRMTQKGKYNSLPAQRYMRYKAEIGWDLRKEVKEPIAGPVEITAKFYMPIPSSWSKAKVLQAMTGQIRPVTKPDTDNLIKGLCDAANGILYKDDARVVKMVAEKWYSDKPRIELEVKEWTA